MKQRGIFIILGGICLIILMLGLALIKLGDFNFVSAQETLSCEVRGFDVECGDTKPVEIFQMYSTSNSHAAKPGQGYTNRVCCGGVTGLSNDCSATNKEVVLKLSGTTNAHVQQSGSYSQSVCLSAPAGNTISVAYRSGSCAGDEATLASMSGATNAHVASTAYTTKICAKITPLSTAIEIRAQNYTTSVSSITFPEGAPGTVISNPTNSASETQVFGGAGIAKPVVTLYNSGASTLTIWYNITTFTNSIVSNEYYLVNNKGAACTDASCITNNATFDADTTTGTTIAAGAGNEKDLYLKVTLSAVAGKTGTSTLTILGEL